MVHKAFIDCIYGVSSTEESNVKSLSDYAAKYIDQQNAEIIDVFSDSGFKSENVNTIDRRIIGSFYISFTEDVNQTADVDRAMRMFTSLLITDIFHAASA